MASALKSSFHSLTCVRSSFLLVVDRLIYICHFCHEEFLDRSSLLSHFVHCSSTRRLTNNHNPEEKLRLPRLSKTEQELLQGKNEPIFVSCKTLFQCSNSVEWPVELIDRNPSNLLVRKSPSVKPFAQLIRQRRSPLTCPRRMRRTNPRSTLFIITNIRDANARISTPVSNALDWNARTNRREERVHQRRATSIELVWRFTCPRKSTRDNDSIRIEIIPIHYYSIWIFIH